MNCPWFERVSACLDQELPENEVELVRAHASLCSTCGLLFEADRFTSLITDSGSHALDSSLLTISRSRLLRALLGITGVFLLGIAVYNFVRGSSTGRDLHDVRHLAIWQASLGTSVVMFSFYFRLSMFIVATSAAFVLFTTAASIVDLALGHRGPWTDVTHVIEACIVALLLLLAMPRARLSFRMRGLLNSTRAE